MPVLSNVKKLEEGKRGRGGGREEEGRREGREEEERRRGEREGKREGRRKGREGGEEGGERGREERGIILDIEGLGRGRGRRKRFGGSYWLRHLDFSVTLDLCLLVCLHRLFPESKQLVAMVARELTEVASRQENSEITLFDR